MSQRDPRKNGFVEDGRRRAQSAAEPAIRAEVEREFAAQLQQASFLKRSWVRRRIEREIKRRVAEKAPGDGLY